MTSDRDIERDAARYRWLRKAIERDWDDIFSTILAIGYRGPYCDDADKLDAAIDAAIERENANAKAD